MPNLNETIEISTEEISDISDGQKIKIQGKISRRPLIFFGYFLEIDNLKVFILDKKPPRLRYNSKIEASGRLLQTPLGPILIVYQTEDIMAK